MKIWHISDTHGFHELLQIPEGVDMVIHSGDCSNPRDPYNNEPEVRKFIDWFSNLPIKHKVFVAGNHDTSIERGLVTKDDFDQNGIYYLENTSVEIEGLNIFGSPHTPLFGNWAFMKARHKLDRVWNNAIPDDSDIVVVHGPPKGVLDLSYDRNGRLERCGDKSLMNKLKIVKPLFMMFGHIHNNEDIVNTGTRKVYGLDTTFSNGSVVTDRKFGKLTSNGNIFELV
jgi:Icc-related predicted phosphoesterase